jgi:hypothetical protein
LSGAQARDMAKSGTNTETKAWEQDCGSNAYNKLLFAAAFPLLHGLARRSADAAALPLVLRTRSGFSARRAGEGEGTCE